MDDEQHDNPLAPPRQLLCLNPPRADLEPNSLEHLMLRNSERTQKKIASLIESAEALGNKPDTEDTEPAKRKLTNDEYYRNRIDINQRIDAAILMLGRTVDTLLRLSPHAISTTARVQLIEEIGLSLEAITKVASGTTLFQSQEKPIHDRLNCVIKKAYELELLSTKNLSSELAMEDQLKPMFSG